MKTIEQELRDWFRPVSPLTAFAKSVLNEQGGGQADDPSKAGRVEYVDPLGADFDLSELPPDQQGKLKKLQSEHRAQYDEKAKLEERRQKAEEFARNQQSRADRYEALARRHNLSGDVTPPASDRVSADAKHLDTLTAQLIKDGIKPDAAAGYAKMLATSGELERQRIYSEMAPLLGEVSALRAHSELSAAKVRFSQVFAVPALAKQIDDNVQILVQQNKPLDEKTVTHLVSMAWGQYSLQNPDEAAKLVKAQQELPALGGRTVTNGGHRNDVTVRGDGKAPVATQPETTAIMSNLDKFFAADLPSSRKAAGK